MRNSTQQTDGDEISEIVSDIKGTPSRLELRHRSPKMVGDAKKSYFWYVAQFAACIALLYLGVALLNMAFSEETTYLAEKGVSLPRELNGCSVISYATKYGTPVCSKFPSMRSAPFLFAFHVLAFLAVYFFLKYTSKTGKGWKLSRYS